MNALSYVVAALREPQLCLAAANALRDLCDANRDALAPHVGAFAELHAGLATIPVRFSSHPRRSISCGPAGHRTKQGAPVNRECYPGTPAGRVHPACGSARHSHPPEIGRCPAITRPSMCLGFLPDEADQRCFKPTDEARTAVIQQLQTLTGVAKGLTRANDDLFSLEASPELTTEEEKMNRARADPRIVKLRNLVLDALGRAVDIWSADASVSDVCISRTEPSYFSTFFSGIERPPESNHLSSL
jgi:hypothetical protein